MDAVKQSSGGLGELVGAFLEGGDSPGRGSSGVGDLLGSLLGDAANEIHNRLGQPEIFA